MRLSQAHERFKLHSPSAAAFEAMLGQKEQLDKMFHRWQAS